MRAIYGKLVADLLFYKKFEDLEKNGFELNPYDPYVDNMIKVVKQHMLIFHGDNVISSHVNTKFNNNFKELMNHNYGNQGEVKPNRGNCTNILK